MTVYLSELQIDFILRAVALKDHVMCLHEDTLDEESFLRDYGHSKKEYNTEIAKLRSKILNLYNDSK